MIAVAAVLALGVWGVSRWASTPNYVSLVRDLDLSQAGVVDQRLTKAGIPHRLGAGGSEVQVPVEELARARVALAKDGLPSNGRPGLELFDKPSWGMTEFTQRITYQRALEGELARTIQGIHGVERAQVHLALPTASPLRKLDRAASASVVLTLGAGVNLSRETIQGITFIVSNSVERLSSDNIAVMDDTGRVLSVPAGSGSMAGMTSWQLDIQRSIEQNLGAKVVDLLEPVVGLGRARAQISATLDFEQIDRTVETFDPDTQVLSSEQRSETEPGAAGETGSQVVINNNYQTSRRVEKSVGSVGRVTRLAAAILIDEKAVSGGEGTSGPIDLTRVRAMVWNAIGADSTRGDRLSVLAVPFEAVTPPVEETAENPVAGKPKPDIMYIVERVGRIVVGAIAVVALLILALRALKTPVGGATPMSASLFSQESPRSAQMTAVSGPAPVEAPPPPPPPPPITIDANMRPEQTAQVLRDWLTRSA
jgi:flagellar M-ring protein FliF